MRRYLTVPEVLAIHDIQIRTFGGSKGVRDLGMLESALGRLQSGYFPGLVEEAAALWESLSQNHPFVDGNKRTAFMAMHAFLKLNGHRLTAGSEATEEFVVGLYETGQFKYSILVAWLHEVIA